MIFRNVLVAGLISLSAAGVLTSPAYAAPQAPASVAVDKCSLHVNIPHPHAGQKETLTITSTAPKTAVQVTIMYKTVTHVWKFATPTSAKTTYQFGVGNPTKNYRVTLSGTVTAVPGGYRAGATCSTSFLP